MGPQWGAQRPARGEGLTVSHQEVWSHFSAQPQPSQDHHTPFSQVGEAEDPRGRGLPKNTQLGSSCTGSSLPGVFLVLFPPCLPVHTQPQLLKVPEQGSAAS